MNKWFFIRQVDGVAHARIFGEIGGVQTAADFVRELGDAQHVELFIDSPGGEATYALEIHAALVKRYTKVFITGRCYSAAAIIATAGRHVTIQRGARMLLHPSRGCVYGTASQLRERADELEKLEPQILDTVCKRTGQAPAIVAFTLARESWFDADEALKFGLVDEIAEAPAQSVAKNPAPQSPGETETEDEQLFMDMLRAFEPLPVHDKNKFLERLAHWARHKIVTQP